jgi:outer membrane protein assembly factor BamB
MRTPRLVALIAPWLLPCAVLAAVPGGGPAAQDCLLELDTPKPNYPLSLPGKLKAAKELRCFDGDAGCDLDGEVNGACQFPLDACFHVSDPALSTCTPSDVTAFAIAGAAGNSDLRALQQAGNKLLPASASACTTGQSVRVAMPGRGKRPARRTVKLKARSRGGTDSDRVAFTCLPREWPTQNYDPRNRRGTPVEKKLTRENAVRLTERWRFDVGTFEGSGQPVSVTSTPTVANGMVFVTGWNGKVYGLRERDGKVRWSYDTGAGGSGFGVQSSATVTPEGRLLVGDSTGIVHCLEAKSGTKLWTASVADTDPAASHIWGSPVVSNGRVFVGRASHSDVPCTQGHLYAFDLETGAELWRYKTVPDRVCHNDTRVTCTSSADCGGGECVPGVGGGVTATVAVDPTGDTVYMGSVGCYTSPSIGNSDALFALDAATGAAHWIYRTEFIEQYKPRGVYHDFGFLNGPLLVDAPDGAGGTRRLVVGPSKDGTIYAVDPSSGALVWTQSLVTNPAFAGFGLFNASAAWTNGTLYTSLYQTIVPGWPESNDHLYAFHGVDGTPRWSAQIGPSWSAPAVTDQLLFVATNNADPNTGASEFYVYDTESGARLTTLPLSGASYSGASIVDGRVYMGYFGGVVAFGLP